MAAGLLILVGLGLFVAGILTGVTVLYWACVAACVVAGVLLIVAWRRMPAKTTGTGGDVAEGVTPGTAGKAAAMTSTATPATTSPEPVPAAPEPADEPAAVTTPHAADGASAGAPDPGVEEVEVTDLLIVVDLKDEVLVVDEHPRYHVAECSWLAGRETIPLPLDEARTDGFTPCAVCSPDRTLADRARARRHAES